MFNIGDKVRYIGPIKHYTTRYQPNFHEVATIKSISRSVTQRDVFWIAVTFIRIKQDVFSEVYPSIHFELINKIEIKTETDWLNAIQYNFKDGA